MRRRVAFWSVLALLFFCMAAPFVLAHRVTVFAVDEGGEVYTESSFGGKRPVKMGTLRVKDADGTVLLTGTTDKKGIFIFTRPRPVALTVEVDAGIGHKGVWTLAATEGAGPKGVVQQTSVDRAAKGSAGIEWQRLEATVDAAVTRAMFRLEKRQRFQDIIGGIGYIVGLCGLMAWMKSRRKTP